MAHLDPVIQTFHSPWDAYSLVNSGNRKRLERFGDYLLIRDDPRAWWQPDLPETEWKKADARFLESKDEKGAWKFFRKPKADAWKLDFDGIPFEARFTDMSKHVGVFPEHAVHWRWMRGKIETFGRPFRLLNLFGYTGAASLVGAAAGAHVTHVDASPKVLAWGKSAQQQAGFADRPIRWIEDDALKFVKREQRRGKFYDGILLDPPKYGRGPKGEIWKVEQSLPELLEACRAVLDPKASFLLLTMYSTEDSACTVGNLLYDLFRERRGSIRLGELVLPHAHSPKQLAVSLCGIWETRT